MARLTAGQDEITAKLNELKAFIDTLVSSGFVQTGAERGPDIGSDHLPVRAGLRWRGE